MIQWKQTMVGNLGRKSKILEGEGSDMKGEEVNKEWRKSRVAARVAGK